MMVLCNDIIICYYYRVFFYYRRRLGFPSAPLDMEYDNSSIEL